MSDFKMADYETPDKYVYDTIEELIATEDPGLVLIKDTESDWWVTLGLEFDP